MLRGLSELSLPHIRVKSPGQPSFMPPRGSTPCGKKSTPLAYQVIDFPQAPKARRSASVTRSYARPE